MAWTLVALSVGVVGLLYWAVLSRELFVSMMHGRRLSDAPVEEGDHRDGRTVAIIVPACNEGRSITGCLESLARQDHADLEIIAANDRSTDDTGEQMDAVAARHSRVRVVHITDLPPGWLGKNHANREGAARTTADWLLFTDGDVMFEPDCVRRAVSFAESEGLDHLSLFPDLDAQGYWEVAAVCMFGLLYAAHTRPWHARNPLQPDAYTGVGAFNLIRRSTYVAIGGHDRLRMEVADDLKLAKLVKQSGFVTDLLHGRSLISVRWQVGLGGVIRGLEKNGFAGSDYRISRVIMGVTLLTLGALLPPAGALLAPGWTRLPFALCLAGQVAMLALAARRQEHGAIIGLAHPVVCMALAWAILRSTALTLWRRGVRWRETFYPLEELRRGVV